MTQSGGISPWAMPGGNSMNTCRPSSKARSGRQGGLSPSIAVAEVERVDVDAGRDRRRRLGGGVLARAAR